LNHERGKFIKMIDDIKIGLSVAAPTPLRAVKAEAFLKGKEMSGEILAEAGKIASAEASPRDSVRGQAWYRKEIIETFVPRMAEMAASRIRNGN